ncbi:HEPN domain-containing protein [Salinicola rhizosphaerae]|uniref:RiboL-PSP-HEPN domain-containing protein n=1 Tax=Salinicola rhizosphaerae TaxID=1443141 RepID=A0ABQ3E975_9GAMM|nr:HEPN domain-containing protein [Salinicola rhizosphaerae]GHB30370.1 hypothetical protein GCM10009038_31430 [Salinicola rhizosphaerae]
MSNYQKFQDSIAAADQLVDMYKELRRSRDIGARGRLDEANSDLLWLPRSAVVASLSALDSYIHGVLYEKIPEKMRNNEVSTSLANAMSSIIPIKNADGFKKALPMISSSSSIEALTKKLESETLSFLSYQAPEKIIKGYSLIGHDNIFDELSKIWQGPRSTEKELKDKLEGYVKRRNQIAHEGDRESNGSPRPMQPAYANDCKTFIESLAARLDRIVYLH